METQTIINFVFVMAFVNYVFWQRNRQRNLTVDTITCKAWRVVGADGKIRIAAAILADGQASVVWLDKDEKVRIKAATLAGGQASFGYANSCSRIISALAEKAESILHAI